MEKLTISLMNPKEMDFEPELKKFCESTGETISRPHFYERLKSNWFVFAKEGDLSKGWVIISNQRDDFTLTNFIRLEMALSGSVPNFAASIEDDLYQLAKDVGAEYIEFATEFSMVAKHGESQGYEISRYICRKPVK